MCTVAGSGIMQSV